VPLPALLGEKILPLCTMPPNVPPLGVPVKVTLLAAKQYVLLKLLIAG
jgi:hypothetical protein